MYFFDNYVTWSMCFKFSTFRPSSYYIWDVHIHNLFYIVIEEKSEIKLLRIEYRSGTVEYGKGCGKLVFRMYTYKFRKIQINLSIAVTCKDIPDEYYFTYRSLLTLTFYKESVKTRF